MSASIAIVGMACRYPDAANPTELWENVLAQRRSFRRMPGERLRLEDYLPTDGANGDSTYATEVAVIEGYEFDRLRYRVAGSTFRAVDLAHWLALDIAAQALADAGYGDGDGLPRETTGVLLGNTLTGEFSRANTLRLRWPYVRRVIDGALAREGWPLAERRRFLAESEEAYKAAFPPMGEETLAGGLSNTIAGRICNHFDLQGGGYTIDGACASSLLAVTSACSALAAGDLDLALAGGVDLSLDPFELVGFARVGALAPDLMRVYDVHSSGFWPGEGCGFVALMRHEDALAAGRRVHAVIRGWGVSSDGRGGITRPELDGQLLALRRAYQRAGIGIDSVEYFEGHGTGTAVGDATELRALSQARAEAGATAPAAIGSLKANIGHTKAAAGIGGLIKATMALQAHLLPPTTGCEIPRPELEGPHRQLRALADGEPWPADRPPRAGVSAMGFGGINTHVVLDGVATERKGLTARERALLSSAQDAELVLLDGANREDLLQTARGLLPLASRLSRSELAGLAAALHARLDSRAVRAAIVASSPAELARRLETLASWLEEGEATRADANAGIFLAQQPGSPRIGYLFPGQGSPAHLDGGALRRRFTSVDRLYDQAALPRGGDSTATHIAQPAIVTASLAGLQVLDQLGVTADVAIGHSLGELTALHWAGALDDLALLRVARARGACMAELGSATGAMASISADRCAVAALLNGANAVIAGLNSPRQTVVAGEATAIETIVARAREQGLRAARLPVSHAFHSPLVAAAAPAFAAHLARETLQPLRRRVVSTVTGAPLAATADLPSLLREQITAPVRFADALAAADAGVDLWLEVGPGRVLSALVADSFATPAVPLDAGGPSLAGLLRAVGIAWVLGAPVNLDALVAQRLTRPFDLGRRPTFFANPCESVDALDEERAVPPAVAPPVAPLDQGIAPAPGAPAVGTSLETLRQLVAERVELPPEAVRDGDSLLGDLHLNSITVAELVAAAAHRLGLPALVSPTDFADATLAGVAQALDELARTGVQAEAPAAPAGVESWVRQFAVDLVERPLRARPASGEGGQWQVMAPPGYPLAPALQHLLDASGAESGVVACLPPDPDERCLGLLLDASKAALMERGSSRFVLVQHGGGAASWARTLHLEAPEITTVVVDVSEGDPRAVAWVVAEASAAEGYVEAHYDKAGVRRAPVLRLLPEEGDACPLPLGPDDVLLVTGGGKGIAAESALALARESGASLALLGRSRPEEDEELAANLERMAAAGVTLRYLPVDVTSSEDVRDAVREIASTLGPVTAALHGAGANVPQLLSTLDEEAVRRTLAPKVDGARNLLAALDPERLRLFIAFGSIIARTGMRGEADYGLANEWLTRLVERYQAAHPSCRCVVAEWSVWSGVGMGQRLGRVEALARQGITPIAPDEGIAILRRLVTEPSDRVTHIVTGRFGDPPTLEVSRPELPFLRFLEEPRLFYPGVELVVDLELSEEADPYLADHVFRGERLFPAVMALEGMVQVATALTGRSAPIELEAVQFLRPIVVPEGERRTIRIAALARADDRIDVVVRGEATGFQADHMRATIRFAAASSAPPQRELMPDGAVGEVGLVPERDLYGDILFHGGRFRRLAGYRALRATRCLAVVSAGETMGWFGRYMPDRLLLGDPAARDAAIHALQACIPHASVLPIGVERLAIDAVGAPGRRFVAARERERRGNTFIYDLQIADELGQTLERWEGLALQAIESRAPKRPWAAPLLGPYLERRVQELIPGANPAIVVTNGGAERRVRSDAAIQAALGVEALVCRRPDGRPDLPAHPELSSSTAHADPLTLAVASRLPVGCDLEMVASRSPGAWRDLLGHERFTLAEVIAQSANEDLDTAGTRVWAAMEAEKKAGAAANGLVFEGSTGDGWVTIVAGTRVCATCAFPVRGMREPLVAAVSVKGAANAVL